MNNFTSPSQAPAWKGIEYSVLNFFPPSPSQAPAWEGLEYTVVNFQHLLLLLPKLGLGKQENKLKLGKQGKKQIINVKL